jgi:hypothetical protein
MLKFVPVLGECLVLHLVKFDCCGFEFLVACEGVVRTV